MEAKELRIGNILIDRENRLCKVEELSKGEFRAPAIYGGLTSLPNSPIPLTEEWLVKFGFEKVIGWDDMEFWRRPDWRKCGFSLLKQLQGYEDDGYGKILPYVHSLQNLYFALTGEELTIKN